MPTNARFERLHPKPQWASRRVDAGVPSMQKLLSSTASFVAAEDRRDPLPPTHIDIQRMRNANEQNPTAGKKKASDAGAGVVDVAWHPNTKVSVMAVAGGDRRVRLFNVSEMGVNRGQVKAALGAGDAPTASAVSGCGSFDFGSMLRR